jgi:hypothetical protein
MDDRGVGVRFPVRERDFYFLDKEQTLSETHPTSYKQEVGECFVRVNIAVV